ncbi:MAG: polysaccharide biosynthesis tyrosine autokinase, partial [Rikenellaceae bacterium]
IRLYITPQEASKINTPLRFEVERVEGDEVKICLIARGSADLYSLLTLPTILTTEYGVVSLSAADNGRYEQWQRGEKIIVEVASPAAVASRFKRGLSVGRVSSNTSITNPTLLIANREVGVDFLNKLIDIYNKQANEAKNEAASKTADFINERLSIISSELNISELELASYKQSAEIVNIGSEASSTLAEREEYRARLAQNKSQLREIRSLQEFILDDSNHYEAIVTTISALDDRLNSMVDIYNKTLLELNTLLLSSSSSNPSVILIDQSLTSQRTNIEESVNRLCATLEREELEFNKEAQAARSKVINIPLLERELMNLERQQEIKAGLYLTMLQRREENALLLAATANNARIFDDTYAEGRVTPDVNMRYMIALLFGILLPVIALIVRDLLRFKITTSRDVQRLTSIPLVGTIPYIKEMPHTTNSVVVEENKNDAMAENFRNLRTNVNYMLCDDRRVILVTSTHQAEGKSFVSANLAISTALLGRSVVVVGLDIRKPGLNRIFGIRGNQRGITSYLSGETDDLHTLIRRSEFAPNLSIILGGAIPPNPTELLTRDRLGEAIAQLRREFDYVILDTAPVGVVTDTLQFSKYADLSLYVCRANVTHKRDYELINEMEQRRRLPNLCTVIIGVKSHNNRYGYGYGYGESYSDERGAERDV